MRSVFTNWRRGRAWLAGALLVLCPLVAAASPVRQERIRRLDALLAREIPKEGPGVIVLAAAGGKPFYRRAFGRANLELGVPLQTDSVLAIGSVTKPFTATAVLLLVEEGRLALNEDIRGHFPWLYPEAGPITVEQVLTHTAGLPSLVDRPDFEALLRRAHSVEELLALTRDKPLHFPPGTGFRYSDSGYILLGALIEKLSGVPYAEFIDSRITRPLGLRRTSYGHNERVLPGRATGYTRVGGNVRHAPFVDMSVPHAAGALFSTVDDLLRWHTALASGRLVSTALLQRAWQPQALPDGTVSGYAMGWTRCTLAGRATLEHGGWIPGYTASFIHLPEEGLTFISLANVDTGSPSPSYYARRAARMFLTGSDATPEVPLEAHQRQALLGRYRLPAGGELEIGADEGGLFALRDGEHRTRLKALSPRELAVEDSAGTLVYRFEAGPDGRMQRLQRFLSCEPQHRGERIP